MPSNANLNIADIEITLTRALEAALAAYQEQVARIKRANTAVMPTDFALTESQQSVTVGLLITTLEDVAHWVRTGRAKPRRKFGEPARFAFKSIRRSDRNLRKLHFFHISANALRGVIVTLTTPKNAFAFTRKEDTRESDFLTLFRDWPPLAFESLMCPPPCKPNRATWLPSTTDTPTGRPWRPERARIRAHPRGGQGLTTTVRHALLNFYRGRLVS